MAVGGGSVLPLCGLSSLLLYVVQFLINKKSLSLSLQTALSSFFQEANIPSHHHQMVSAFGALKKEKR